MVTTVKVITADLKVKDSSSEVAQDSSAHFNSGLASISFNPRHYAEAVCIADYQPIGLSLDFTPDITLGQGPNYAQNDNNSGFRDATGQIQADVNDTNASFLRQVDVCC